MHATLGAAGEGRGTVLPLRRRGAVRACMRAARAAHVVLGREEVVHRVVRARIARSHPAVRRRQRTIDGRRVIEDLLKVAVRADERLGRALHDLMGEVRGVQAGLDLGQPADEHHLVLGWELLTQQLGGPPMHKRLHLLVEHQPRWMHMHMPHAT